MSDGKFGGASIPSKVQLGEQAGRRSGLWEEGTSQRNSASAELTAFTSQRQPRGSPAVTPPQKSQVLGFYKFYSELRNQFYNFGSELRTFFLQKLKWNNSRANFENPNRIGVAILFHWNFFHNSRRDTAWKTGTGVGQVVLTVEPYSFQFRCKLGIFPENVPICQGKVG